MFWKRLETLVYQLVDTDSKNPTHCDHRVSINMAGVFSMFCANF